MQSIIQLFVIGLFRCLLYSVLYSCGSTVRRDPKAGGGGGRVEYN